ncbi:MAG: HAD-IA family hydrolase [Pseudomonadota bacterium]
MFEAVIFDCDGVLVDSEVLAIKGERAVLEALGLVYSPGEYVRRFVGMHDDAFLDAVRTDYRERLNAAPPDDLGDQVVAGRRREMSALEVIPGAGDAMIHAKAAGAAIAVASSSRAHFLESKLKRMGLWHHTAPHVYSADLVDHGKPAPDVFLYAADKVGVAPKNCLVLEDSENGVRAGVAAGMTVWGFLGGGHIFDGHGARLTAAGAAELCSNFSDFQNRLVY